MGFNDAMSGYKKIKNDKGITNSELLSMLGDVTLSFGTPELDTVAKKEAVVVHFGRFDIYAKCTEKAIEMGCVYGKNTSIGKNLFKELAVAMVSDAEATDTASGNRAVDELYDVVMQLVETGSAESHVAASSEDAVKLYMRQKVVAIKDKYSICQLDETPVYWVEGNIFGLDFAMETADGKAIYNIKKKLVAIMPEYSIVQDKKEIGHIKKKIRLTRPEISGKVDGKDLVIKGDLSGYHFSIALDGMTVGTVDTERLTWGDVYSIDVLDPSKQDLIVAIAVIVDNTLKNKS